MGIFSQSFEMYFKCK